MEIENGTHFWAKMDDKVVMMARFDNSTYGDGKSFWVCGGWECPIHESEFEVIQIVPFPPNVEAKDLYYI